MAVVRYAGPDELIGSTGGPRITTFFRIRTALRRWIDAALLDERERYLSRATDQHDLARRLQAWDEEERRRGLVNMLSFPP